MTNLQQNVQRILLGFDPLLEFLNQEVPNYPPYNQFKVSEHKYVLEIAVTGFKPDEIRIEVADNDLVISATPVEKIPDNWTAVYRGLARREFTRRFKLGKDVEVVSANIEHGVLTIELLQHIPEAAKPKSIQINVK